jgi:tetraacyldisaccharide 4'-kinase
VKRRSIFLYPFSIVFGLVTGLRNFLYNSNILPSVRFSLPVISIGNITVGGTGKTPFTEYLVSLLKKNFRVATLSRGYKRKTRGFLLASPDSDVSSIGDEPLQVFRKFPDITVAVDADRVHGINSILRERPDTSVVILDDAFQHRRVSPGMSILLSDFSRPFTKDFLLPFGNLRESSCNMRRADIIIITKTPGNITPVDRRIMEKEICKAPYQELFFTSLNYMEPVPVFKKKALRNILDRDSRENRCAVLVTGIANAAPLKSYVEEYFSVVIHLEFEDHHRFTSDDIGKIRSAWKEMVSANKYILTTEKDATRLREAETIDEHLRRAFYYIPVGISFLNGSKEKFDKLICDYVGKNKRNNRLSEI